MRQRGLYPSPNAFFAVYIFVAERIGQFVFLIRTEDEIDEAERLNCRVFEKPFILEELNEWLSQSEKRIEPHRELSALPPRPDLFRGSLPGKAKPNSESKQQESRNRFSQIHSMRQ